VTFNDERSHTMKLRRITLGIAGVALVIALMPQGGIPALAAPVDELPIARANPDISADVIASLPDWLQQRSDIHLDASLTPDTPLVIAGGDVAPGQSAAKAAAAAACQRDMVALPGTGWTPALSSPCGYIGLTDTSKIVYTVFGNPRCNCLGKGQFQALGYKQVNVAKPPLLPKLEWRETWYGAGTTEGGKTILWGKVAGVPAMKVAATGTVTWSGGYSH
jgi:hypothetical protein